MSEAAPPAGDRILGCDLARAFALLGMMTVHFSLVMAADVSQPMALAWIVEALDGRAAATFVVLAGVGVTLMSRRAVASRDAQQLRAVRRTLPARGAFLLVVGFLNLIVWQGDILRVYGVSLLLAAWLIAASNRRLIGVSAAFVGGFVILMCVCDYDRNWDWSTMHYHNLWTTEGVVRNLFYDGFRSVFPWSGLLVFGMWLGRLDLCNRAMNNRAIAVALLAVFAAEVVSQVGVAACIGYFGPAETDAIVALLGTKSMPPLPMFLFSAGGIAVATIAVCVRIMQHSPTTRWLMPFVATGQMALTWYFAHIIVGLGTVAALGLMNNQSLPAAMTCGFGFFTLAVGVSAVWKVRFRHGPLENAMRAIAG